MFLTLNSLQYITRSLLYKSYNIIIIEIIIITEMTNNILHKMKNVTISSPLIIRTDLRLSMIIQRLITIHNIRIRINNVSNRSLNNQR